MLENMNLPKRFSSLVPVSLFSLLGLTLLSGGSTSCGTNQACFYFTKVEYEIGNSCPSRQEALTFFRGNFCSTPITSVDSDGAFDGSTCCYTVTESDDFFDCGVGPVPPPEPGIAVTSVGSSGVGGIGGSGGVGGSGAGGSGACSTCAEFLTNMNPDPLCEMSLPIYEKYSGCKCDGACATVCKDSCINNTSSMECEACLVDTTNGCGNEFNACASD